jgi:hypothetical protein
MTEDDDDEGFCPKCGALLESEHCWKCGGEGVDGHECGDDTCCCLHPEDNITCDICDGTGRIIYCPVCHPRDE